MKEHLEVGEYLQLLATPCLNEEVREAFILSCYTGLRWADVSVLSFKDIGEDSIRTRIIQVKTGQPVVITMHPVARKIIERRRKRKDLRDEKMSIFRLPTPNGANKVLKVWIANAGINKMITWSSASLSFAILLQDRQIDNATVALLFVCTRTTIDNQTKINISPDPPFFGEGSGEILF